jgi:putative membrane protein
MALWGPLGLGLLVLAVLGSIWLLRNLAGPRRQPGDSAMDELERRYARGEIDRDDYLRRRSDLTRGR